MKKLLMFAAIFAVSGAMFLSAVPDCGKGSDGKLFPNPDDCSTFYQCRNGGAILQECPEDLVYNKDLETCSWSWDAPPCDEGVSGGGGSNYVICYHESVVKTGHTYYDCGDCTNKVYDEKGKGKYTKCFR